MFFKSSLTGAIAALALATPALAEIEFHSQYARSSNAAAGAAFMIIRNTGDTDDRLVAVRSDAAQRVELHTHREDENEVMRMIHVEEGFDLPAGGEIAMVRGAEHVMFMGLTEPFEHDQLIPVTFIFETAGEITVDIPVDQDRTETVDHSDHTSDG